MIKYLVISAVTVLGSFAFPNFQQEITRTGRIIGGTDAPVGFIPYIVSLQNPHYHFCGGSIINAHTVVTAAHCIRKSSPQLVTVVAGVTKLSNGGDKYNVGQLISHPTSDIGLIILEKPIQFSNSVQAIDWEKELNDESRDCVVSGWGETAPSLDPDHLQYINLKTISNEECLSRGQRVQDEDICTCTKVGEGICYGDSGGPLVADGKLIGCVSRGLPCAEGRPDVYTRMSYFKDWIEQNLAGPEFMNSEVQVKSSLTLIMELELKNEAKKTAQHRVYLLWNTNDFFSTDAFPKTSYNERIVGGSDAPKSSSPYVVSRRFSHMCGGSIIDAYTILTAGHCIRDVTPPWLTVVAGTYMLDEGGDRHSVREIKVHPIPGDIGLVILENPLQFSDSIQPINLEEENNDDVRDCVVCGWGQTSVSSSLSNHLQCLKSKTLSNKDCLSHGTSIRDDDICTLTKVGEGICGGDSGSPLVANNTQIGIVARGTSCAVGRPDIYTRVCYFKEWIRENRKQ
ncbi:hypothetical protein ILUMI_19276 [Ignelater luminosus]|uniref:Peptidase S1 domain-containing protein n=1 Tax=Ignelater luminosus TaxID=2038154 RepID=A0A8K0CMQ0_IGNLU|nr:hypothetical protein ILUMI_19276 [Ignelater luminosus]